MQEDDQLQIPQQVYSSKVQLPSGEFSRIVRELGQLAESVTVATTKNSIKFEVRGDVTTGEMELMENNSENDNERVSIDVDKPVVQSFSLTFL